MFVVVVVVGVTTVVFVVVGVVGVIDVLYKIHKDLHHVLHACSSGVGVMKRLKGKHASSRHGLASWLGIKFRNERDMVFGL